MALLCDMVDKVKREVDFARVGMIVCHNGVVRSTSRDGLPAEYLDIEINRHAWDQVLQEMRAEPGIVAVEAFAYEGRRQVGEDVLLVVVAGDIRENVFPVLEKTVNRLKKEATRKKEGLVK